MEDRNNFVKFILLHLSKKTCLEWNIFEMCHYLMFMNPLIEGNMKCTRHQTPTKFGQMHLEMCEHCFQKLLSRFSLRCETCNIRFVNCGQAPSLAGGNPFETYLVKSFKSSSTIKSNTILNITIN